MTLADRLARAAERTLSDGAARYELGQIAWDHRAQIIAALAWADAREKCDAEGQKVMQGWSEFAKTNPTRAQWAEYQRAYCEASGAEQAAWSAYRASAPKEGA